MSSFHIGNNKIDVSSSVISGAKGSVSVPEKGMLILLRLAREKGDVVPYQDLIDAAWGGPARESALYNQVAILRKALEEDPRKPSYIKTVSKRGYRLIGASGDGKERRSNPAKRNYTFIVLSLALSLVLSIYLFIGEQYQEKHGGFSKLTQHLRSPSSIILISGNNGSASPAEMKARSILGHHLSGHKDAALTMLPANFDSQNLEALTRHFAASKITSEAAIYLLKPLGTKDGLTVGVTAIAGSNENLDSLALIPPAKKPSDLELSILELQWLKDRIPIAQKAKAPRSVYNNPTPATLGELLKSSLTTLKSADDFDVEGELTLYGSLVESGLQHHPGEYVSHYAAAEYACLLERYDTCARELGAALNLRPFDSTALKALSWNLLRFSLNEKLTVYFNYLLNPYADTFNLYRDSLLRENSFTEAIGEISSHKRLLSHESTRWWLAHAQESSLSAGVPQPLLRTNSDYNAAYGLLDNGFFEEAQQLLSNSNVLFFDKRALGLQLSIWRGEFNPEEWRSARELAEDRETHQNTLDKLRMIYFDIYSHDFEMAGQGITGLFPEMHTDDFEVTRDNFRIATYYSLVLRKTGNQTRASAIANRQQVFLNGGKLGGHDPFWGLSVAEYKAIAGDFDSARASLGELIAAGHQTSNAFWFWPPLSENIFLREL